MNSVLIRSFKSIDSLFVNEIGADGSVVETSTSVGSLDSMVMFALGGVRIRRLESETIDSRT